MSDPGWGAPGEDPAERDAPPVPPAPGGTATIGPPQRPSPWELPPPAVPGATPPAAAPPTGWPVQPVAPLQPPRPGQPWPTQPLTQAPGPWTARPPLGPSQAWAPRSYPQLLRGPNHRWWRPLASLGIVLGLTIVVFVLFLITIWVIDRADPSVDLSGDGIDDWANTPVGMLVTNLVLAGFIPVTMFAVWWGHGWRPRWLGSVAGGIRWRWLGLAMLIAIGFMAPVQVALTAYDGSLEWKPAPDFWWLVVVVLLSTPLQAAGEEYLARGWLTQATGSLLPGRIAAGVLGAIVSGLVFAGLHGFDQSFWLFADRLAFGLVASGLAWWTGGLEGGIALHTANNYVVLVLSAVVGDLSSLDATDASALPVLLDIGLLLVPALLLAWLSRRLRLQRLFRPPTRP